VSLCVTSWLKTGGGFGVSLKKGKELSILTKNLENDVILIYGGNKQ
jgi:hypothetical protein